MRRKLHILILILSIPAGVLAQFSIGFQGGGNLSEMDFTNNQDYRFTKIDGAQGLIGGLVLQFLGEKHAGVQMEFNYSQRGWVENDTTGVDDLKYHNQMDYLEMPILTHVNIGGGKLRGVFNIGPYMAYALNRTITEENVTTGSEKLTTYTFDSKKDSRFDFGLTVGAGMEYRFAFGKFAAEARYMVGLGDVNKVKTYQSEVSQFRVITVLVRYTLPIIKSKAIPETTSE